jgi:hypothetical protein
VKCIEAGVGADRTTQLHRRLPLPIGGCTRCGAAVCGWLEAAVAVCANKAGCEANGQMKFVAS